MNEAQVGEYLLDEEKRATGELLDFLRNLPLNSVRHIVRHNAVSVASTIHAAASEVKADLLVIGTRGRGGIAKLMLGSVGEEILRAGHHDILAVPRS